MRGFLLYWIEDVVAKPYIVFGVINLGDDAKAATSLFLLPLLVGATISALLAGALSDRFGRKVMVYIAGGVQAATAVGMILFPTMSMGMHFVGGFSCCCFTDPGR